MYENAGFIALKHELKMYALTNFTIMVASYT